MTIFVGFMPRFRRIVTTERRASRRIPASDVLPQAETKLATGQEVRLINFALSGSVLINSKTMLSPGSPVRLKLSIPESAMILEGRVHRCRVVGLKHAKIQYEAAILLDRGFPEPLATLLRHVEDGNSSPEESCQEFKPDEASLPETAQLWILKGQDAEATA